MEKKHKGAASELIATVWLLKKGYEVFRNVSSHGTVDIIAKNPKTNECTFIDVTTILKYKKKDGTIAYNYGKKKCANLYIKVIVVDIETNKVYWYDDAIFNRKPLKRTSKEIINHARKLRAKGLTYMEIEEEIYGLKGGGNRIWQILNKRGD